MWDTGHVHVCQRFLAVCGTEHWGGHHHGLEGLLLQLHIRTYTYLSTDQVDTPKLLLARTVLTFCR